MRRPNSRLAVARVLFCCTSITLLGSAPALAAAVIGLTSVSDHPGAKVAVTGSKFGANEAVDIYFDSTDEILAVTDANGRLAKHTFTVPSDASPGEHWVTAVGRRD